MCLRINLGRVDLTCTNACMILHTCIYTHTYQYTVYAYNRLNTYMHVYKYEYVSCIRTWNYLVGLTMINHIAMY